MRKLENFTYSRALVLGLAKSGTAAAKLLLQEGLEVRVNDKKADEGDEMVQELAAHGAEVIAGSHPLSVLDGIEVVVKNPGIPYTNPVVQEALLRKIPMITEIELAGQLAEGTIIGITGSNGKTTTTTLTVEMLRESNQPAKVAGNIGKVATEVAQTLSKQESLVLELSSFQLMGIDTFRPRVAVLLNIFEAHLDYHQTFENYKQAKFNLFRNQTKDDYLIYNADDPHLKEAVKLAASRTIPFSVQRKVEDGAWIEDGAVFFLGEKVMDLDEIVLVGDHQLENALAALAAAKLSGATNEGIRAVLTSFAGVKHRLQFVDKIHGRLFYNDSKATNILATQKALDSFQQPTILLAGGLDRGNEFTELGSYLSNVKAMVVFGETADKLKTAGEEAGVPVIENAGDVKKAAQIAYTLSEKNDVILLSPACASWDQYRTFEERGDMFIQAVHTLM
ncbi:UDP-N-acetylmuramoyl-L-alanine--D-glutamate ligase [Lentibacillus sediminis]|uniref:UDP-N-acetylmuramoyl-L-alanine--D-glutamate ligase n=1 Tax=Lentibacillus sediminis TaxID=1940529 RepID=UPI000C1BDFBF|nr:UDP-N-acetylmuramoyl-L-alanine--D-glutamate ligase [Lentibacillus sediminis]